MVDREALYPLADKISADVITLATVTRSPGVYIPKASRRDETYGVMLPPKSHGYFKVAVFGDDEVWVNTYHTNSDSYQGYASQEVGYGSHLYITKQSDDLPDELRARLQPDWPEVASYSTLYSIIESDMNKTFLMYFKDLRRGRGYVSGTFNDDDLQALALCLKSMAVGVSRVLAMPEMVEGIRINEYR